MLKEWNGPKIAAATLRASKGALNKLSADIVGEAKRRAPVGVSGHYRRSIDYVAADFHKAGHAKRNRLSTLIGVQSSAKHDESAIVALVLEDGRRRGAKMPPMSRGDDALTGFELWVKRVINPQPPPRRAAQPKLKRKDKAARSARVFVEARRKDTAVRGVAYLIARKMKARGLPARKIISNPFERISPFLPLEIQIRLAPMLAKIK